MSRDPIPLWPIAATISSNCSVSPRSTRYGIDGSSSLPARPAGWKMIFPVLSDVGGPRRSDVLNCALFAPRVEPATGMTILLTRRARLLALEKLRFIAVPVQGTSDANGFDGLDAVMR